MASGNTLFTIFPQNSQPPATLYATLDVIAGASTPAESILVLDFDDTTQEYADFHCFMPANYSGGGITLTIVFSAAEAATDVVAWQAAFRRVADDAEDLDTTAHTYDYNEVVATAPSAVGEVAYDDIAFTNGADMDSVAAGEYFILRVTRDPTPSSGTDVTGDASLHAIHVKET
jgi:hypothetical protein